ncbi:MAG: hypothetical protein AVDCRST_MAG13-845, partial [uncultured Solirubrobacteraceae bacterium]
WVRSSGTRTPSRVTRPQRSARCQKSTSRRWSTRGIPPMRRPTPCQLARRRLRPTSAVMTAGHGVMAWAKRASRTATRAGSRTSQVTQQGTSPSSPSCCQGRRMSPCPSSSGAARPASHARRTMTPLSRSSPGAPRPSIRSGGCQGPRATSATSAVAVAAAMRAPCGSRSSRRSGSSRSTGSRPLERLAWRARSVACISFRTP